jgi:hypothetical protein
MIKLLLSFYKVVRKATDGKHTPPGLTAVNRLVLICLVLGFSGPILWHALVTMPVSLVVVLGLGIALRIALWYRRRHH